MKSDQEETRPAGIHHLMYNPSSGKNETVLLVPMGQTILRQVTFNQNPQTKKMRKILLSAAAFFQAAAFCPGK